MTADPYFATLSEALRVAEIHQPCLVLDLERLDRNVIAVESRLGDGLRLRIVDKSLPCVSLLSRIAGALGTTSFMSFHLPVSYAVLEAFPEAQVLVGKPMPVGGVRQALTRADAARIVWLVDTDERLASYGALAAESGLDLRLCFEVDVGLHRGGYANAAALSRALERLRSLPRLHWEGIMGYEAHIGHVPRLLGGPKKALARARDAFRAFASCLGPGERSILNIAGSSTALLYDRTTGANEVSMGSAFVLPADFDVPSLAGLEPAAFIATPILKVVDARVPGLDERSSFLQQLGLFPRRGCFLHGGKWMAEPVSPPGMKTNATIGFSTNQQFMSLPNDTRAVAGDYASCGRPRASSSSNSSVRSRSIREAASSIAGPCSYRPEAGVAERAVHLSPSCSGYGSAAAKNLRRTRLSAPQIPPVTLARKYQRRPFPRSR